MEQQSAWNRKDATVMFKKKMQPTLLFGLLAFASFSVLSFAYFAEYVQKYQPCSLCYYERLASWLILGFSVLGIFTHKKIFFQRGFFGLILLVCIANLGLSFYHIGLEQGWWVDHEICQAKLPDTDNIEELRKSIMSTASSDCSVVEWELFGLSMSVYDFLYTFFLFVICCVGLRFSWKEES